MTSKLRIDLSHKTERVRFSGTPPLNYLILHSHQKLSCLRSGVEFDTNEIFYEFKYF